MASSDSNVLRLLSNVMIISWQSVVEFIPIVSGNIIRRIRRVGQTLFESGVNIVMADLSADFSL